MVLEVETVSKRVPGRTPLVDVSFTIDPGEIALVLGDKGAGKSTLLRLCAGVLEPDSGRVRVFKIDCALERRRAQERLGYVGFGAPIDMDLSPWNYLRFLAAARGFDTAKTRHAVRDAATQAGLDDEINREGRRLTALERRQVALAAALLGEPVLLILDEPFAGLDDAAAAVFAARIAAVAPERGVLMAAANRDPAMALATRALVLEHGRLHEAPVPVAGYRAPEGSPLAPLLAMLPGALQGVRQGRAA